MKTDISDVLRRARDDSARWSRGDLERLLATMPEHEPRTRVDWDVGAGERWARLLAGDRVQALLRVDLPFAMVERQAGPLGERLQAVGMHCLTVEGLAEQRLCGESGLIKDALSPSAEQFDPRDFTAFDLWWSTI